MSYDFSSLIGQVKLSVGRHKNAEAGMCAMEFVSWLEGEEFSDSPECTCPVLAAFVRRMNDNMSQAGRDRLLIFLPKLVGTKSPEHEKERGEYLAWQAIRIFAPIALRAIGLEDHAQRLDQAKNFKAARAAADSADSAAAAAAVAYATYAARAAAYTAYATYAAADAAADSAAATAAAAALAEATVWDKAFSALEAAIDIGPSGEFSQPIEPIIEQAKIVCPV